MMDKRVFITVLVCTAIFLFWNTVVAPPKPKPQAASQPTKTAQMAGSLAAVAASQPASIAAAPTPQLPEQKERLADAKLALELSSHGGALTQATLKEFKEGGIKRGEQKHEVRLVPLVKDRVDGVVLTLAGEKIDFSKVERTDKSVVFTGNFKGMDARATWTQSSADYVLDLQVELKNTTGAPLNVQPGLVVSGVFNEKALKDKSMFDPQPDLVTPAAYIDGELFSHEHGKKDSPKPTEQIAWAGVDRQYFLLAAAPVDHKVGGVSFDETKLVQDPAYLQMSATLSSPMVTLAPAQTSTLKYQVYAGPKATGFLRVPGRSFEQAVNYKVWIFPLGFLSRPMLWILNQAHAAFGSYGLAILMLTLIVKLLLLPVTQKSFMSMQVMRDLKPELDKIKARFPDDREKQGLATMQLYKERNVNPFLSGCLPALLQMPVYLALWRTLFAAVELYQQEFLWLGDLTAKDPFYILPLLLGLTMFAQQKLSPPMGDPQQQKIMLYMMPPLMTMFMINLSSGLVFYIFVNTILTILQQAYINRKFGKKPALKPAT